MPTWKLTLEYDGTRYHGWQEQKNARTVAGELRNAAGSFLDTKVDLIGAGRTDAGVHALAQVARLRAVPKADRIKPLELLHGLNDRLPVDINVLGVQEAQWNFDPRRDALARYYLYQISTRRTAFAKRYVWWLKDSLNVESMQRACSRLVGRHDFARFCDGRAEEKSTIVVVEHAEVQVGGDLILFRIGASHFLWKMVRRLTGALVEIGRGKLRSQELVNLVNTGAGVAGDSSFDVAKHTAPPSGLFLERVIYEPADRAERPGTSALQGIVQGLRENRRG